MYIAIIFGIIVVVLLSIGCAYMINRNASNQNITNCSNCKCNEEYRHVVALGTCFCSNVITGDQLTCEDSNGHSTQFRL